MKKHMWLSPHCLLDEFIDSWIHLGRERSLRKSFGLPKKKEDVNFDVFHVMDVRTGESNEHFFVWEPGTLPVLFPCYPGALRGTSR